MTFAEAAEVVLADTRRAMTATELWAEIERRGLVATSGKTPAATLDISLRGEGRTVLIDTKYYVEAMSSRFGADKLRPGHLYQMTAYLQNLASRGGSDANAVGVLLYPQARPGAQSFPTLSYRYGPHRLTATAVDLTLDWSEIHRRLMEVVSGA